MARAGALFSRVEVGRLLNIPQWLLANFAETGRYRYGLSPSVHGAKGRGKRGLYSLADVYKVALAYRMVLANLSGDEVGAVLKRLFPEKRDPMVVAVNERKRGGDARCLVVNLCHLASTRFFTGLPDGSFGVEPPEWSCPKSSTSGAWVTLRTRREIADEFHTGMLRAFLVLPFDELLGWVDSRILGRDEQL